MKKLTVRQQVNRIRKWHAMATPAQIADGLQWYSEAHSLAVSLASQYGVSVIQAAQVISVLSPQKKWNANKREAIAIFNEHFNGIASALNYFATKATIKECCAIMAGSFAIPPKRIKTYSFADNIAYIDSREVTIDRHALRVAYDDRSAKIDKVGILDYKQASLAYNQVADSLGLKAYQLQAITWLVYKDTVKR